MDINRCAEEILLLNLQTYKEVYFVSKYLLKNIVKRHIWQKESKIVVLGYQRDIDRFVKCFPKDNDNVVCECVKPQDWMNTRPRRFDNEDAVRKIARFQIDKLVIVSEDLRYLLQMYLINEGVSYEIVDIYELMKMEYSKVLVKSISSTPWVVMKEHIKKRVVLLSERFIALNKVKCIRYWREASGKRCDNYDGILVKKYCFKKASNDKEKRYYLAELIIDYLLIKDFQNAFLYIDEYTRLYGKEDNTYIQLKQGYENLLSQMREQLRDRKEKDIIIFWCDSLSYSDFEAWNFLEEIKRDSLLFENAYTHGPWTRPTLQAMFTGLPYFEGKMYRAEVETDTLMGNGKILEWLKENDYQICEIGLSYLNQYEQKTNYVVKNLYLPAPMILWEALAQLLKDDGKKKFIICHMLDELHPPCWNGESEKLRVYPGKPLDDPSEFIVQRRESAVYHEKQISYYYNYFGGGQENICSIFMSDHGDGRLNYSDSRLHTFCFVKDNNIKKGNYNEYFSYLNFGELINYVLQPTENHFNKLFSDYVLIQSDHPYSHIYCNLLLDKLKRNEDVKWQEWMGFRGIIKDGYKLIYYPGCHEIWFDLEDKEIEPDEISDQNLVRFMRDKVGNEFPDIYAEEHYVNTRILFEKLHLDYQDNV